MGFASSRGMTPSRIFALLLLGALGCSSRQFVPVDYITTAAPPVIQVYNGYKMFDVQQPTLSGDSVRGTVNGTSVAIPLRQVQLVSAVKFSSARTALLITGVAIVGGFMAYAVTSEGEGELKQCDYSDEQNLSDLCRIQR